MFCQRPHKSSIIFCHSTTLHLLTKSLFLLSTLSPHPLLQSPEESGDNVMILQFLPKDQSLHAVVIGQQSHHVLQEEALTVGKEVLRRVNLCMDVVGDDGVEVNQRGTSDFTEVQQTIQLEEICSSHELKDVSGLDRELLC